MVTTRERGERVICIRLRSCILDVVVVVSLRVCPAGDTAA